MQNFPSRTWESWTTFLGIEVVRNDNGMMLNQNRYIMDMLEKFKMSNASSCPTPLNFGKHKIAVKEEPLENPSEYRILVGGLQYLVNTRPGMPFAVN